MKKKSSSPTMKDVARIAGVSLGTVSNVFNGIPVSEPYKIKVEEAAKELGYQINRYARGLKTNHSRIIALILPSTSHPYFGELASSIQHSLIKRNYQMLLALTNSSYDIENRCIQMVSENKVDGIIALTYNPDLEISEDLPFVSIDRFYSHSVPCVSSDNYGGGYLAGQKLYERGCRKMLFMNTRPDTNGEPDKRQIGFEAFCKAKGISCESIITNDEVNIKPFKGMLQERTHDGKPDFDGIFCNTDFIAYHVMNILRSIQIRVPEDVQIIGFDGINIFNDPRLPVVSTIVQSTDQIAESAVSILLSGDRSKIPSLTCLPVYFRAGGTTKE